MEWETKFAFAVEIASARVSGMYQTVKPKEIASVIEECFEGIEIAEERIRNRNHPSG